MKILLTGAAGRIGRVVGPGLRAAGHDVVALDRVPPEETDPGPWETADCCDPAAVDDVVARHRPDAVAHFAGLPGEETLPDSLTAHVVSTAALLDAMVAHGVRRIVYASSNHAVGCTPHGEHSPRTPLGVDVRPRPDTNYGTAKVAAEALLSLYADRAGIDAVACRIGTFLPRPNSRRSLASWLSPDDCVRMVEAALTTPSPGFAVLWGVSANTRGWWDLEPGRALGFEPRDDAEQHRDAVADRPQDEAEDAHVGGEFVLGELRRPFDPHGPTP